MEAQAKIYVAGHRGLAGSAIARALRSEGFRNVVTRAHAELDLRDASQVEAFFARERPAYVFLAAAKVGGIHANNTYRGDFIHDNLAIQTSVIEAARRHGTRRLIFLGSSCVYPRECPQPIREEYLLTGPLEETNKPYAVAKIAGIEMCRAYNRQHGTRFLAVMPTNLYGPGDNYDPLNSHVLPALLRRAHEAKLAGAEEMTVWGTGRPRREFLHSDDMADACFLLMQLDDARFDALLRDAKAPALVNIGCGQDRTVEEIARTVCRVVGFKGSLSFDTSKPDGTPRKILDVSRIGALGWAPRIALEEGLHGAYEEFRARG